VAISAELNLLTAKELGFVAKTLAVVGWHRMRKEELVHALVLKSRSKNGSEVIQGYLHGRLKWTKSVSTNKNSTDRKQVDSRSESRKKETKKSEARKPASTSVVSTHSMPKVSEKPATKKSATVSTGTAKETQRKREIVITTEDPKNASPSDAQSRRKLRRDISTQSAEVRKDQLVLLVRDPFWLHAFWEMSIKTVERAKVAMGPFWHTALPVIRLFRLESDGVSQPKRIIVRDILVHGGVNNWYLDVVDPPSSFQIELGYLSREKKFYPLLSSNIVMTPQQQLINTLDQLDGNWRGVAEDLDRIYKLTTGEGNNPEIRKVFEEQLHRPMSTPLLSRYRAVQQQVSSLEKTRRNFLFNIDVDLIIHGRTDPSVQVNIRNEPIRTNPDGSFVIRFAFPEKRHVFPIEATGCDGVETQRLILTVERNTRVLETLFQEPANDD
jgi:hypothetical protein